ncbi:STAS-like domain-containing protein [Pasteurella multocida]|uniref:STAS-like domain-containing protein n=1 Tax=Pasteurella multocida TaxID=747 RepID=UPI0035A94DCE
MKRKQMTNEIKIYVKDFSDDPFGRDDNDGPFNGDKFRREYLSDAFKKFDKIIVDFDGLQAFPGTSFIGSAFVGLMTIDKIPYQTILSKLEVLPKDSVYPETVKIILNTQRHLTIGRL